MSTLYLNFDKMKFFIMIYAYAALGVLLHCSVGIRSENSQIEQNLIHTVSKLTAFHAAMDSITFTPDQFEHIETNITTNVENFTVLFYNLEINQVLDTSSANHYETSLRISTKNVKLIVSLPCDFEIGANMRVWSPNTSQTIISNDSVNLNLRKMVFSKPLITIAANGSIQENDDDPEITVESEKICLETHTKFQIIAYKAIENLIDEVKQQMETMWRKQFKQQIDKTRNNFKLDTSTFLNDFDDQQARNAHDVYTLSEKIESLEAFGIITKSITIEGLSNFAKLKMTVMKDAERVRNSNEWNYHCARTTTQIETNKLKGQLEWRYNDSSILNSITFYMDSFILKVASDSVRKVTLGEIQIDPMSSYCSCSNVQKLLHHVFAEKLKLVIFASLSDRVDTIFGEYYSTPMQKILIETTTDDSQEEYV